LFRELFESGIVGISDWSVVDSHFVEETVIRRRTEAEVATVVFLCGFTEDVCGGMPKDLFAWRRIRV
jgi:hypothetical protein